MNGQQSLVLQAIELTGVGNYNNDGSLYPASDRNNLFPTYSDNLVGFRPALYVKL